MAQSSHFADKLHLMARGELVEAFSTANSEVSAAIVRMTKQRAVLLEMQKQMAARGLASDSHRSTHNQAVEALRQRHIEGKLTELDRQRLLDMAAREPEEAERLGRVHDEIFAELRPKVHALFRAATVEQAKLYPLRLPLPKQPGASSVRTLTMTCTNV